MRAISLNVALGLVAVAAGAGPTWAVGSVRSPSGAAQSEAVTTCAAPGFFATSTTAIATGLPAAADFNRDGNPDLAVVHADNSVSVLLGNGTGGFSPAGPPVAIGGGRTSGAGSPVAGDFNVDGNPDLAVLVRGGQNDSSYIVLLLGGGTGGLTPGAPATTSSSAGQLIAADFNLDGRADFAVAHLTASGGLVTVLLQEASGGLTGVHPQLATAEFPVIRSADFNRDGKPDFVVNAGYGSNMVATQLGNGDGTFTPGPVSAGGARGVPNVSVADVNNDGIPDILGMSYINSLVPILVGDGNGAFTATTVSVAYPSAGRSGGGAPVGDFNGDGNLDLAIGNDGYNGAPYGLTILMGNGAGQFTQSHSPTAGPRYPELTADFNRDGRLDLIVATATATNEIALLLNNCGAPASQAQLTSSPNPSAFGQAVTLTATVTATSGGGIPSGVVQFASGSGNLGSATLSNAGVATLSVTTLTEGVHNITATYQGSVSFAPSTSSTLSHTVSPRPSPGLAISSSPNPSNFGQSVTLTATATPAAGFSSVTGSVQFKDGTFNLGSPVTLSGGMATATTTTLSDGAHLITAVYSGDSNHGATTSAPITHRINGRLSINDPTANSAAGAAMASFTVILTVPNAGTVTVRYDTADRTAKAGTDYTATSGTLTFNPGETTKTISVPITGQTVPGPAKDFFLTLSNPTNATIAKGAGVGTITFAATGSLAIYVDDPRVAEGYSGVTLLGFTVSLSSPPTSTVSVDYLAANGTALGGVDFTSQSGTLTFRPGQTQRWVVVPIAANATVGSNRTFFLNLTNAVGATIAKGQGTGTILEDDPTPAAATVAQYRLYSEITKEHLYTTDSNEYAVLGTRSWNQEGTAYTMFKDGGSHAGQFAIPLYRMYHGGILQHHWTTDAYEVMVLAALGTWDYEGIAGYVLPATAAGTTPLYRLMLERPPLHIWTTDLNEKNVLSTLRGWVYEGIVGYVIP